MAGLIAGHIFPRFKITERAEGPGQMHQALLRFRSDEVARVTNIPFTPVLVRKGIHFEGAFCAPSIRLANLYSLKVSGRLLNRSIWATEPATRYVAPPDFYERLLEAVAHRIEWGAGLNSDYFGNRFPFDRNPTISTIPMPDMIAIAEMRVPPVSFDRAPITVKRMRVPGASVHQTIYFPGGETPVYRASITGDLLIIESMGTAEYAAGRVLDAFGLHEAEPIGTVQQRFGKIAPIDNMTRKEIIHRLTLDKNVYSVGRFATWRNILLDDVVKDLRCVQQMMAQGDAYHNHLINAVHAKIWPQEHEA